MSTALNGEAFPAALTGDIADASEYGNMPDREECWRDDREATEVKPKKMDVADHGTDFADTSMEDGKSAACGTDYSDYEETEVVSNPDNVRSLLSVAKMKTNEYSKPTPAFLSRRGTSE